MSKIICDICGTTYPETASTCPICGYAKNTTEQTAAEGAEGEVASVYTPVKGGRFSKSNVRKRNNMKGKSIATTKEPNPDSANKGLVVVILVLMLAIAAVLCYIGIRFFFPNAQQDADATGTSSSVEQSSSNEDENQNVLKPCTGLELDNKEFELTAEGTKVQLSVVNKYPEDTTDAVAYSSSNPMVATVDEDGTITAVGGGEAIITVTCGSAKQECKVKCSFGEVQTPPGGEDEPDEPVEVPAGFVLELKLKDFTLSEKYPNPVSLYKKHDSVKATDITWTSDDEKIATIDEKGVVTAVGKGYTTVYGEIGDQKVACKVNVAFDPAAVEKPKYTISHSDVTLTVGGSGFMLSLKDENQANVQDVTWTANEEGYVTIDGRNIKPVKSTNDLKNKYVIISATVEDYTYTCKVRVTEAKVEE